METLSVEAALDAMAPAYGAAYIQRDADTVRSKQIAVEERLP